MDQPVTFRVVRVIRALLTQETRLRLEGWCWDRYFDRKLSRLDKKTQAKEYEDVYNDAYAAYTDYDEQLKICRSRKLTKRAGRLLVPVPSIHVPPDRDPPWSQAHLNEGYFLTDSGFNDLRNQIRMELKARRDVAAFWFTVVGTTLLGLIGAVTGLIAVLKK